MPPHEIDRHRWQELLRTVLIHTIFAAGFVGMVAVGVNLRSMLPVGTNPLGDVILLATGIALTAYTVETFRLRRDTALSRSASLFVTVMEEMTALAEVREKVQALNRNTAWRSWTPAQSSAVYSLSIHFERIAYMCRAGLLNKQHVMEVWARPFVDSWATMHLWVKEELRQGNRARTDRQHLNWFARECARHIRRQCQRQGLAPDEYVVDVAAGRI
jgi:hypothetical protein